MELREFIANTITEIQNGVQLAIDQTHDVKGAVNPIWGSRDAISEKNTQDICFDIAVTAAEKANGQAGAGIKVIEISVDKTNTATNEKSRVSRIQFKIPVVLTGQVIVGA